MITWKKQPRGSYIAELGDIRIVLKEYSDYWQISMGIYSYSKDMTVRMIRPMVNIFQFDKPCDEEQAITRANDYMDGFVSRIMCGYSDN